MQQRFILKEEVSISKNEIESLLDSLGEVLKAFDQANKVSQIPLPKPKFEIDFLLPTSVTILRAVTMCSTDCAYDNSNIILIGDVYCPNTECSGRICLHKKSFQSLGRSDYQYPQCGSVCQVHNVPFEEQINCFFCRLVKEFIFSKKEQSQFKKLLEMCFVLASIVSTQRNANPLEVM